MSISREAVREALVESDPEALRAVLAAAGINPSKELDAEALSEKLVRALWWRTHTPFGALAMPDSLGQLVDRTAKRLKVPFDEARDDWQRLDDLTKVLLSRCEGVDALADLDPKHVNRLRRGQWLAWTGASVAGVAAGSGWISKELLRLSAPYKRLLPLVPTVGPILVAARRGMEQVARFSTPIGVTLALASANQALGPEYDRALALLLGVALVRPRPEKQRSHRSPDTAPAEEPAALSEPAPGDQVEDTVLAEEEVLDLANSGEE